MRASALGCVLLLSCASEAPDGTRAVLTSAHRGARLHPVVIVSDDGLRMPLRGHDALLGIDCAPRRTSDGVLRCLPQTQHIGEPTNVFADAACTLPATTADPGFPHADNFAFLSAGSDGCNDRVHVVHIAPVKDIFERRDGKCVALEHHWPAYTIGLGVPATTFVALTPVVAGRYNPEMYAGEDGSLISYGFTPPRDAAFDATCTPELAADGRERCLVGGAFTANYADARCTVHALRGSSCASHPVFLEKNEKTGRLHAFELGPQLDSTFSVGVGGSCAETKPGIPEFAVGEEIPPEAFAAVQPATFGGSRLRVRAMRIEQSLFAEPKAWIDGRFLDVVTNQPCDLSRTTNGEYRCVPNNVANVVYRDAKCTERVAAIYDELPTPLAVEIDGSKLAALYVVGSVEPSEIKTFEPRRDECVERWKHKVAPLGLSIPLESFARADVVME